MLQAVPFVGSGDAGPASGTQVVLVGTGAQSDSATLVVIGDITYLKGNARALEDLAGLSTDQAAADQGQWVLFSTNNPAFAQIVAGVRSHDVAEEIALKGPYTFGAPRTLDGFTGWTPSSAHRRWQASKKMRTSCSVRAGRRAAICIVEEDTVGAKGKPNGAEHFIFSKWGETGAAARHLDAYGQPRWRQRHLGSDGQTHPALARHGRMCHSEAAAAGAGK